MPPTPASARQHRGLVRQQDVRNGDDERHERHEPRRGAKRDGRREAGRLRGGCSRGSAEQGTADGRLPSHAPTLTREPAATSPDGARPSVILRWPVVTRLAGRAGPEPFELLVAGHADSLRTCVRVGDDPARRRGLVLRVGRAAGRPAAAREAGDRRRRCRSGRELRGEGVRRPHGDGRAGRRAACAPRLSSCRRACPSTRLRARRSSRSSRTRPRSSRGSRSTRPSSTCAAWSASRARRARSPCGCAAECASRSASRSPSGSRGRSSSPRSRAPSRNRTACCSCRPSASSRSCTRCRSSASGASGRRPPLACTAGASRPSATSRRRPRRRWRCCWEGRGLTSARAREQPRPPRRAYAAATAVDRLAARVRQA